MLGIRHAAEDFPLKQIQEQVDHKRNADAVCDRFENRKYPDEYAFDRGEILQSHIKQDAVCDQQKHCFSVWLVFLIRCVSHTVSSFISSDAAARP